MDEKKELLKIRRERKVSKKEAMAILQAQKDEAAAAKIEADRLAAEQAEADAAAAEAKATANTRLLEEIRDLLKNK